MRRSAVRHGDTQQPQPHKTRLRWRTDSLSSARYARPNDSRSMTRTGTRALAPPLRRLRASPPPNQVLVPTPLRGAAHHQVVRILTRPTMRYTATGARDASYPIFHQRHMIHRSVTTLAARKIFSSPSWGAAYTGSGRGASDEPGKPPPKSALHRTRGGRLLGCGRKSGSVMSSNGIIRFAAAHSAAQPAAAAPAGRWAGGASARSQHRERVVTSAASGFLDTPPVDMRWLLLRGSGARRARRLSRPATPRTPSIMPAQKMIVSPPHSLPWGSHRLWRCDLKGLCRPGVLVSLKPAHGSDWQRA
jgi:hypothetical protein